MGPLRDDDFFERSESTQVLVRWIRSELELQGCQPGDRDRMAASYEKSHPRVARLLLKAPVGLSGANLSPDEAFASRVFDEQQQATNVLVAESAARSFRPGPMNSSIAMRLEDATGALVEAGEAKPISAMTISDPVFMAPRKTVAICATTKELIKPGRAEAFINSGVRNGESNANNAALVALIKASTSLTVAGTVADFLGPAMGMFTTGSAAVRYFVMVASKVGRLLAGKMGSGGLLYPNFSPGEGGQLSNNLNAYVVDALNVGEALVVDGSAYASDPGQVRFDFSGQTTLQFSDTPTQNAATPTTQTSLWQTNSVAVMAERSFSFEPLRSNGAVLVTGII